MRDYPTELLVATYTNLGLGFTFLAAMAFFFGITALIAGVEYCTRRAAYSRFYSDRNDVPFHENYSTLVDFLVLNPLVVTVVASVTLDMRRIPDLMVSTVRCSPERSLALAERCRALLDVDWLFPALVGTAVVCWAYYLRRAHSGGSRQRLLTGHLLTESYLALATVVMMLVVLAFVWRISVIGWYLSNVTELGFVRDPLSWSIGLNRVSEFLSSVNWFFGLMSVILAGMAIHDFLVHRVRRKGGRIRVAGLGVVIVFTVLAVVVPMCSIHENIAAARTAWIEDLLRERDLASGATRASIADSMREVMQLHDWPISSTASVLTVIGQVLMLAIGAILERLTQSVNGGAATESPPRV